MGKRDTTILNIIIQQKRIEVTHLAEMLQVAQSTIRKDLDELEARGLIKREHGFAIFGSEDNINNRLALNYEVKQQIAQKAAELVGRSEMVMIESGSCCTLLAEKLTARKAGIKIVTNSAFIAAYIRKYAWSKTILLGGDYQNEAQVMVGPIARQCMANFFMDKLFIGTDGFSELTGFTGNDHYRVETVNDMAKHTKQVIILTESNKFQRQGVFSLLPLDQIHIVITDNGIPTGSEQYLTEQGIRVIKTGE